MREEDNINKYISSINVIIKSGNPKYISYISKEYMKYRKANPVIATVMEDIIRKEASDKGSIYAIFIDNDNGINLEAMSDISKITNTADFIKNVEALSSQDIDFGDLTSDELIIEGMEIAEQLAREIETLENSMNYEDEGAVTTLDEQVEEKTSGVLSKLESGGKMTAAIMSVIAMIKSRISSVVNRVKGSAKQKSEDKKQEKVIESKNKENSIFPKIEVDELSVIRNMKERTNEAKNKIKHNGEIDSSQDSDDFSGDSEDSNTTQEDDEPDI